MQKAVGFPVQIADGELTFTGKLHFIKGIGRLFDGDVLAIPQCSAQFRLAAF